MFGKSGSVFGQMKKTGFTGGANLGGGKGKGKRHRWNLANAKPKAAPADPDGDAADDSFPASLKNKKSSRLGSLDPNAEDPGVFDDTPVSNTGKGVKVSVHLSNDMMGELRKMNPKKMGRF